MTLHEAIVQVLCENMHEMTTQEIAEEINQRRLYTKKDSTEVTAFQIHGRTRNYPQLFTRRGSWVGLVEWDSKPKIALSRTFENSSIKTKTSEVILIQDDMTTVSSLENVGFENIGTIQQLFSFGLPSLPQLNCCGLYAISIPKNYNVVFLSPEDSSVKKNIIKPWSVEHLKAKWVDGAEIIYYGLAGYKSFRSLRERLRDLLDHGSGKTTDRGPHKGGEIMWQLQCYEQFSVWIFPTGNAPEPKNGETSLLKKFYEITGKLPFANRKF